MRHVVIILLMLNLASYGKPNILFLLGDDINRNQLGVYGGDAKTPNLNQMVKEGVNFTRAYSHTSMCSPFRHELYSGRSTWTTETMMNHNAAKDGTTSIATHLKPLGYKVGLMGKRHIGTEETYPFDYINAGRDVKKDNNQELLEATRTYITDAQYDNSPFCLFVASHDGHGGYSTGDSSVYDPKKVTIPPYWKDVPHLRGNLTRHLAEITNLDALLGDLRDLLRELKIEDETILFYCSEQGTSFPFAKFSCYDNGVHTALVASMPGTISAGHTVTNFIQVTDIVPSIMEAITGSANDSQYGFDGVSQWDNFTGADTEKHEYVYSTFCNKGIIGSMDRIYPIRGVRDQRYSFIWNPNYTHYTSNVGIDPAYELVQGREPERKGGGANQFVQFADNPEAPLEDPIVRKLHHRPEFEFYDRELDPHEVKNIFNDPAHLKHQKRLWNELQRFLAQNNDSDPIATEKAIVKRGVKY